MKKLFISVMICGLFSSGAVIAVENPDQEAAQARLEQCRQEAISKGVDDVYAYIYDCLDKKLEYK